MSTLKSATLSLPRALQPYRGGKRLFAWGLKGYSTSQNLANCSSMPLQLLLVNHTITVNTFYVAPLRYLIYLPKA